VLVPPPRAAGASLRIRRATVRGAFADLERTKIQEPVQEILDELRGDR
jgi:hypothetical protein